MNLATDKHCEILKDLKTCGGYGTGFLAGKPYTTQEKAGKL